MFFLLTSTFTGSNLRYKTCPNRSFYIRFSRHIPVASSTLSAEKHKSVNICTLYFIKNVNFCTLLNPKNVNFRTTLEIRSL